MAETEIARLRRRLTELKAENAGLRAGAGITANARDAARIVDAIAGSDGGTDPFAAAVRATRMPMVISNPRLPDNPIVFVNDAFCRLCNYSREEILGRNCRFLQGPDTDPATVTKIRAAIDAAVPVRTDILNYRKTGETFWNRLLMAPVRDAEGRLAYFFASQVDVTIERERLEGLETHNAALMAEVADRLRTQEEASARLLFATEAGRLGVWELDLVTEELSASPVCKDNFGRQRDRSFTIRDLEDAVHPEDRGRWTVAVETSVATQADLDVEYRVVDSDGAIRWVQVRAQVARAPDGRALRMAGISLDVTARKIAETRRVAMGELSDRIRDLDDPAELACASAEILGRTLGVSRAGYGTIDAVAETVTIERDWTAPGVATLAGVFRFRDYGTYIDDLKRGELVAIADARADPRTAAAAAALDGIGSRALLNLPVTEVAGVASVLYLTDAVTREWTADEIAFIRDVADRTQTAVQRRRAEEDLRVLAGSLERQVVARTADRNRLWELSTDIMLVLRFDGIIAAVNPAWTAMLRWTHEELVGHSYVGLVHPEDLDKTLEGAKHLAGGLALLRFDNRCRHKDGSYRWIAWAAVPGDGFINAVGRDFTAEKEQAEALHDAEERLRQSQKMEAVGQLTGGLAHDFNNLLTGISGSLELLQRRVAQGRFNELERYVVATQGAAKRAAALTHRLLAFSRRQTLDPKPTDINRLALDMVDMVRRTVGPEITVEVVGMVGLWTALVDPNQLENALLNLCINARDAMPGGGLLTIETGNRWIDDRMARDRDLPSGQYLSLCVSDTGTGMSPAVMARAFDPFFTTKPLGQGTGLGLSMIYGFARQSGGQVRIHSKLGQGSTVCIYLPRHYGDAAALESESQPEASDVPRAEQGETVLVVDDEPTVRMLVADVLSDLGYTTVEAADGAAGLTVLRSETRIDLLITDVGLPGGMNGRQVADAARDLRPGLKVLFITGYAENAVLGSGHVDPGMQVLTKPFAMDTLANRIRELIGVA